MPKKPIQTHSLAAVRQDINDFLTAYYETQAIRAREVHADYGVLWDTMTRHHQAGGKRFRPFLVVMAYEALGGQRYSRVLPVAASLELLHTALLIHDDIIDRDSVRHGQPNIAGLYQRRYEPLIKQAAERRHFATSAALLAGDLLLSDAYKLIQDSIWPQQVKAGAANLLNEALYGVIGGELLDTEAVLLDSSNVDSFLIAEQKTALYSCIVPLAMGGVLAGAVPSAITTLREVGRALGIAFQFSDDLLGTFGTESQTGKTTLGDIREGKRTYLLQTTYELASKAQLKTLDRIIGNPRCTPAMAQTAREIMQSSGARARVEQQMQSLERAAQVAIERLPITLSNKDQLKAFTHKVIWRAQ